MKIFCVLGFITTLTCGCSPYSPLNEVSLRLPKIESQFSNSTLKATYLGNTTIHITDGKTDLLIDGFLSRPPAHRLFLGPYCSDRDEIEKQLERAGISKVDAVLVGHTHGDHALDAPYYAKHTNSLIMGTPSYAIIHKAAGAPERLLHDVSSDGYTLTKGKFKITFVKSEHIEAKGYNRLLKGEVNPNFSLPTHFTKYNCGETYAIHISHPEGNIAVTTSAGSEPGQWSGLKADVVFLGIGLLSNFPATDTITYWQQSVEPLAPRLVIATHWDNFSKKLPPFGNKLPHNNQTGHKLSPPPFFIDQPKKTMAILKSLDAGKNRLRVIDLGESICLTN